MIPVISVLFLLFTLSILPGTTRRSPWFNSVVAAQIPTPEPGRTTDEVLIRQGSIWKYLAGSDYPGDWKSLDFNSGEWFSGPGELGFGSGNEITSIHPGLDPIRKNITTYFRRSFFVRDPNVYMGLLLRLAIEDGGVVYINGNEVYRTNLPEGQIEPKTPAIRRERITEETELDISAIRPGINLLAVEIHLSSPLSSSLSFDLELRGMLGKTPFRPTPLPTIQPTQTKEALNEFYVAPNGSSQGNGSINQPWDLGTAFKHPDNVRPGDTIWLRSGTYGSGGKTKFVSDLEGNRGKPITIRAFPGERVIIDGAIEVRGEWSTFWGLEVMNSDLIRTSTSSSSDPSDIPREGGFQTSASNTKFINNIVHDTRSGFGLWEEAQNTEVYGNLVFNNGFMGVDRGHGHGIYTQNQKGTKRFVNNIIFNNYSGYGFHVYSEEGHIEGYYLEGNIVINDEVLIGGLQPASRITVVGNHFFGGKSRFGYRNQENIDLTLRNNMIGANNDNSLEIKWWKDIIFSGNTIWNDSNDGVYLEYPEDVERYYWNLNQYLVNSTSPFDLKGADLSWDRWQQDTLYDKDSIFTFGRATGQRSFVYPNYYETKKGNIVVYNWDRQDSIQVDVSELGLEIGDTYVLHNVQDYYTDVQMGIYDGEMITVPMNKTNVIIPVGWNTPLHITTFPTFGVFILTVEK